MKIDLNNAPDYIKCLKNFYGFQKDDIFELRLNVDYDGIPIENKDLKKPLALDDCYDLAYNDNWRAPGSRLHIELINSLEDGIFEAYELNKDEKDDKEIILAANIARKEYSKVAAGDTHSYRNGFIEGAKWAKEKFKN